MTDVHPHRLRHPRVYGVPVSFALQNDQWAALLDHCAAMAFSHVLVSFASCGMRAAAEDVACAGRLAEVIRLARQRQIEVLLDVAYASDAGFPPETGGLPETLPDPRGALRDAANASPLSAPWAADAALESWIACLRRCLVDGLAGFCLRCIDALPPDDWRQIIRSLRQTRDDAAFLAWTPGLSRPAMASLARSGVDGVFLSSCWWDLKASWLFDEYADLRDAPLRIAMPDAPWGPRMLDGVPAHQRIPAARRALTLAAWLGDGVLVPLGFELGWSSTAIARLRTPDELMSALGRHDAATLHDTVEDCNNCLAKRDWRIDTIRRLAGPAAPMAVCALTVADADAAYIVAINPRLDESVRMAVNAWAPHGHTRLQPLADDAGTGGPKGRRGGRGTFATDEAAIETVTLAPGEVKAWRAVRAPAIASTAAGGAAGAVQAARVSRLAIEALSPAVDGGRFAVKHGVGQPVRVEADILIDGHDVPSAMLLWRPADAAEWREVAMRPLGNDRWHAEFTPDRIGRYEFTVQAWRDPYINWCAEVEKKCDAGQDIALELQEGAKLLRDIARRAAARPAKQTLREAAASAVDTEMPAARRVAALVANPVRDAVAAARHRPFCVRHAPAQAVNVEPPIATFASWYELFPRSQSDDASRHGTFDDVMRRLPAIRDMGFDVLYFPPIHPIGETHRKGRNNSPAAQPDDPGSPYAIGSAQGGHDAIHPSLGTLDDFRRLNRAARAHGLLLALDFAVQCSPDHPWLKAHPGWFDWRPDGSLRYAENPPKKYEDIVNVDFYARDAVPDLWLALRDVVLFWIDQGVTLFRVDNPHTKPLPFWEWLIADVRARHPEAVFLSEAFTRPKMMYRLAKAGFSQSYTYFTWRHAKWEFIEYLSELTRPDVAAYFRPHFFVNTPDINPGFLQHAGRPGFLIRAALAATLSGLWGMYNGFELCEAAALPGREEYLDSEKYQLRAWDWDRPGNIVREITQLNRIRRAHPALQSHLGLTFYNAFDENILYFGKATPARDDVVLVAINLDPRAAHDADIEIPLWEWGLPDDAALAVENLLEGTRFTWRGKRQRVRLTPEAPYALWCVGPASEGGIS